MSEEIHLYTYTQSTELAFIIAIKLFLLKFWLAFWGNFSVTLAWVQVVPTAEGYLGNDDSCILCLAASIYESMGVNDSHPRRPFYRESLFSSTANSISPPIELNNRHSGSTSNSFHYIHYIYIYVIYISLYILFQGLWKLQKKFNLFHFLNSIFILFQHSQNRLFLGKTKYTVISNKIFLLNFIFRVCPNKDLGLYKLFWQTWPHAIFKQWCHLWEQNIVAYDYSFLQSDVPLSLEFWFSLLPQSSVLVSFKSFWRIFPGSMVLLYCLLQATIQPLPCLMQKHRSGFESTQCKLASSSIFLILAHVLIVWNQFL